MDHILSDLSTMTLPSWVTPPGNGEKERYKHLNEEFQRIARRDKKAFFSDQCKEREENNRMGKTRDIFKKIRDTKGTFHAKMDTVKDRNGMDLTEVEDIKKSRGPAPVGSRDSLRRTALAIKRIDKRRKTQRLDLTGLCGKLIKFVTPNLL